jgi:hypothetical protein
VFLPASAELRDIAERVRRRFHQQSVLTFDYVEHHRHRAGAVEVEVLVSAQSGCATGSWQTKKPAGAFKAVPSRSTDVSF